MVKRRAIATLASSVLLASCGSPSAPDPSETNSAASSATESELSSPAEAGTDIDDTTTEFDDASGDGGLRRDSVSSGSSLDTEGSVEAPPLERRAIELFSDLGAADADVGALVELPDDVLFDFDDDQLKADAQDVIADLAELAELTDDVAIHIVGHTDGIGDDDYNLDLSQRRANAVVAALVDSGVDTERLEAAGVGSQQPLVEEVGPDGEDDEDARARNRRVDLIFEGVDLQE